MNMRHRTEQGEHSLKLCYIFFFLNERSFRLIHSSLFIVWNCLRPFEQFAICTETVFWTLNCLVPTKVHWRKMLECFHQKP